MDKSTQLTTHGNSNAAMQDGMLLPSAAADTSLADPAVAPADSGAATPDHVEPQTTSPVTVDSGAAARNAATEKALDDEWIARAKVIVGKSLYDPYVQNREIGRLRSQYLKAQYNKDIKIAKDD